MFSAIKTAIHYAKEFAALVQEVKTFLF